MNAPVTPQAGPSHNAFLPRWPGWRNLPREARDTLFNLGVAGWTIAPHVSHLPWWCTLLSVLLLAWRAQLAISNAVLPRRSVVVVLLGLALVLTLWSEGTLMGKEAGVTLLVVLLALKTLEMRGRRDALVLFFLGFFVVLTHFLYSQSLWTALAMLVSVTGLLTALVLAHMPVGRPSLKHSSAIAVRAALLGSPIMVALFLLFPRVGPLWGVPQDGTGQTGLGGNLTLGSVAELAQDDSIALRLRFLGAVPPTHMIYLRGPVLSQFDGREWSPEVEDPGAANERREPRRAPPPYIETLGQPLHYEMTLEPSSLKVLPLLEATPARAGAAPQLEGLAPRLRPDFQWEVARPIAQRMRFEAQAWPRHRLGGNEAPSRQAAYTALPAGSNPRTVAWARELQASHPGADTTVLVERVLAHIRQGRYTYTLQPGVYVSRDAIDEFWFDRQAGFCEHFASSFVVAMRAMGVPARIVTGYQGMDAEPVDGFHVVRQRQAHAWAEVWRSGAGWVRVDPTAAVAPERVMQGRSLAPRPSLMAQAFTRIDPQLLTRMRHSLEALNNRWNQWVMNYSRTQQYKLLEGLGVKSPDWTDLAHVLISLLLGATLVSMGWVLWDRHRQDPWARLQQRVQQRLAQLAVPVQPHEAPRTRARLVREALGPRGEPLAQALEALDRMRYAGASGRRPDPQWWRQFEAAAARCKTA